jgi:CRISPR-associated protein Cmr4
MMSGATTRRSFEIFHTVGLALDPIHVGTGGARLGRVDNTIVRDPVTRIPKIPGSSLAGVHRAYTAMAYEDIRDNQQRQTPYYPNCAGQGQSGSTEHCGISGCEVCAVFGRASSAGLAGFSDAHVLLFPVATREGPVWLTCPSALKAGQVDIVTAEDNCVHRSGGTNNINLGWLLLPSKPWDQIGNVKTKLDYSLPEPIKDRLALVSDKLFSHIVNSNLEVRTSVAIDPATGAAEEGALFTYEALPRGTVLIWDVTCRDPRHFPRNATSLSNVTSVNNVVKKAHDFIEALGIGGMGTRGMGRLRILSSSATLPTSDENGSLNGKP